MSRILIAAAWPYASGPRHLGHVAGAYLPADIVARYHRLAGDDVLFVSGSDQHGTPITVAAERDRISVPYPSPHAMSMTREPSTLAPIHSYTARCRRNQ